MLVAPNVVEPVPFWTRPPEPLTAPPAWVPAVIVLKLFVPGPSNVSVQPLLSRQK